MRTNRLHMFANGLRRSLRLVHEANVERHALLGRFGAQAIDNALIKCAQTARDAVARDQRQRARCCRSTCFEGVAEVICDLEDLYPNILADAGLIREDA